MLLNFKEGHGTSGTTNVIYQISHDELVSVINDAVQKSLSQFLTQFAVQTEERLLTIEETLKTLSVSRATLWRIEKAELLTPVGCGKQKRFRLSDVQNYMRGL